MCVRGALQITAERNKRARAKAGWKERENEEKQRETVAKLVERGKGEWAR